LAKDKRVRLIVLVNDFDKEEERDLKIETAKQFFIDDDDAVAVYNEL
jgi:hypothetical protein